MYVCVCVCVCDESVMLHCDSRPYIQQKGF